MTILGVFLFASIILTSCGGPEADAKKLAVDCYCEADNLMKEMKDNPDDADKLKEDLEKLSEKCDKMEKEMEEKYKDEESDEYKEFDAAFDKEIEKCE